MEASQKQGYLFGGPQIKGYSILGCILGSPYFGKLPHGAISCVYIVRHSCRTETMSSGTIMGEFP